MPEDLAAALAPIAAIEEACDIGRIGDRLRRCVVVVVLVVGLDEEEEVVAYVGLAERVSGGAGDVEKGASVGSGWRQCHCHRCT